jgi:hypothetical protein
MRCERRARSLTVLTILLVMLVGCISQPLLYGKDGSIASGAVVNTFIKDKKESSEVALKLRPAIFKDSAGLSIPHDGVVIKGGFTVEATEWTQQGTIEHNSTQEFQTAKTLEHVKVFNGSVRLEDVPAELTLSASQAWGKGVLDGLEAEETLTLAKTPGMAFQWDSIISNASNEQENVVLKVDSAGVTHAVYEDNSKGLDIYYARSLGGIHYSDFKHLDTLTNRYIPQKSPELAVDSKDWLHVVYADGRTTTNDFDIFYTKSMDHGVDWSSEVRVDHGGTALQGEPAITVDDSGNIYVAWEDHREGNTTLYYNKNFGPDIRVSTSYKGYQLQPDLTVDTNGVVHCVWRDNRSAKNDWRIYHAILPPGATDFQDENMVAKLRSGLAQYFPTIEAGDSGRVWTAWSDNLAFEFNIYVSYCDNGVNFTDPERVSPLFVFAVSPAISYRDGTLHIVWYDFRDNNINHIYYINTTDGKGFSSNVRVDHGNGTMARSPAIAAGTDGWPRIAWVDFRQHQNGDLFTTVGTVNHTRNGTLQTWSDLGSTPQSFSGAEVLGDLPVGTFVDVLGSTSPDNKTWSSPVHMLNDSKDLPLDRYLHLTVFLSTNNTAVTPALSQITIQYRKFAPSGTLVSSTLTTDHPVSKARVEWGAPRGDEGLMVSLSLDGGLSWIPLTNGAEAQISTSGTALAYKLDMTRKGFGSPSVEYINILYTEHSYPKDLTVTVGDSKVWHYSGQFTEKVQISNLAKAMNDYLGSLSPGSVPQEGNITVPVEITSGGLGDVLLSDVVIFWASVTEPDGRPLSFKWTINEVGLNNQTNYTMTYKVPYTPKAPRTDYISVEISNGYLSVKRDWELSVLPSNRAPIISSIMPADAAVIVESKTKTVDMSVTATDPDNDTLSYTWTLDGTSLSSDAMNCTFDPNKYSAGDHVVRVEVSDGKALVFNEWTMIILPGGKTHNPTTDWGEVLMYALLAFIVLLLCGVVFVESYRRARSGHREQRKHKMAQEDKAQTTKALKIAPKKLEKRPS